MWREEFGKKIARVLALMANRPNIKPDPHRNGIEIFDGGERKMTTGITSYRFTDGSKAFFSPTNDFNLSIEFASGEKVKIAVSPNKCVQCGFMILPGETSCMICKR